MSMSETEYIFLFLEEEEEDEKKRKSYELNETAAASRREIPQLPTQSTFFLKKMFLKFKKMKQKTKKFWTIFDDHRWRSVAEACRKANALVQRKILATHVRDWARNESWNPTFPRVHELLQKYKYVFVCV